MRRSIDGLMAIIRDTYQMDPYAHALYLFCGKPRNTSVEVSKTLCKGVKTFGLKLENKEKLLIERDVF